MDETPGLELVSKEPEPEAMSAETGPAGRELSRRWPSGVAEWEDEGPSDLSHRLARRRALLRLGAIAVIVIFVVAIPLGDALTWLHLNGRDEAAFFLLEVVLVGGVWFGLRTLRSSRRRSG